MNDAKVLARIHADSWLQNYQRVLSQHYLQQVAPTERATLWRQRLCNPKPHQRVLVARQSGDPVGFACVYLGENSEFGSYLDNLHVISPSQGRGIGKALLHKVAEIACQEQSGKGLCLLVNQDNVKAQNFYQRQGAVNVREDVWHAPDGNRVPTYWFVWSDPAKMLSSD